MAMIVLLSFGLGWLGIKMREAERQRRAVEAIRKAGGIVFYSYELESRRRRQTTAEPPGPSWLRELVGEDFFADVGHIYLNRPAVDDGMLVHLEGLRNLDSLDIGGTQVTDTGLGHLRGLTKLRWLGLSYTQATEEGIEELRKALPNCDIRWDEDANQ